MAGKLGEGTSRIGRLFLPAMQSIATEIRNQGDKLLALDPRGKWIRVESLGKSKTRVQLPDTPNRK